MRRHIGAVPELAPAGIRVCPDADSRPRWDDSRVRTTVLIVDDHAGFRRDARALLEAGGFDVVGEAADGASGVTEAERLRPVLVLLDLQLPDIDGFEVAKRISEAGEGPAVVLTSSRSASTFRRRLEKTTARGFVPKSELSSEALVALLG